MNITRLSHPKVWEWNPQLRESPILELEIDEEGFHKYFSSSKRLFPYFAQSQIDRESIACHLAITHAKLHGLPVPPAPVTPVLKMEHMPEPKKSKTPLFLNVATVILLLAIALTLLATKGHSEPPPVENVVPPSAVVRGLLMGPRLFAQGITLPSKFTFDPSNNLNVNCAVGCGGGSGGTSSSYGAAFPAAGTAIGVKNGLNMVNLTADNSGNLNVAVGGNAAVTVADGADVTQGAKTDAASTATDTTSTSVVSILKEISKMEQAPAALAAGTNVIGHAITDAGSIVTATLSAETTKVIGTVNQGTSPWVSTVSGPDATAVAPTRYPLQVGGIDNTTNCSAGPCVQNAVFANGSLKGNEFGLVTRDEADQVIVNQLAALISAQQNVRIRGTFGRTISSTNDAIDVNVKSQTMSQDPCQLRKSDVPISQTATTLLVAGSGGNQIWVCYARLVGGAAEIPSFIEGTGATCGTGTLAVSGSTTAANGESYAANGGFSGGSGSGTIMATKIPGNSLCLQQSGSNRIAGNITFVVSP